MFGNGRSVREIQSEGRYGWCCYRSCNRVIACIQGTRNPLPVHEPLQFGRGCSSSRSPALPVSESEVKWWMQLSIRCTLTLRGMASGQLFRAVVNKAGANERLNGLQHSMKFKFLHSHSLFLHISDHTAGCYIKAQQLMQSISAHQTRGKHDL